MRIFFHGLRRIRLAVQRRRSWKPFADDLDHPVETQERVLREILRAQRDTTFGREHGFGSIGTPDEFRQRVPIQTYEGLRPYIERQDRDGRPHLNAAKPILYARTSGTSGAPKHIPIVRDTVRTHRRTQEIATCRNAAAVPGIYDGKILAIVSPAVEGHLPSGTPFGSMSGLIYETTPVFVRSRYLVPPDVFKIADPDLKYRVIAAFALGEREISFVASANPSTFLRIASLIETERDLLTAAVENGSIPGVSDLPSAWRGRIQARFRPNPARAAEIRAVFAREDPVPSAGLWPRLRAVGCWLDGSCRLFIPPLRRRLRPDVRLIELGYLASEFRGSINVDPLENRAVPTIHENFFEFSERDAWDAGERRTVGLAAVKPGVPYQIIVTTRYGLYRYFINDVVVFGESFRGTPTIRFLEKGAGTTNITGEKLHESQVTQAMDEWFRAADLDPRFFVLAADERNSRYDLYVEAPSSLAESLASDLDARLSALNIEYQSKRASGRLGAIRVAVLRAGAGEAFKRSRLDAGQRESQYKHVALQTKAKLEFEFDDYLGPSDD